MKIFENKNFKKRLIIGIIIVILCATAIYLGLSIKKSKTGGGGESAGGSSQVLTTGGAIEEISDNQIKIKSISVENMDEIVEMKLTDKVLYQKYAEKGAAAEKAHRSDFQKGDEVVIYYMEENNAKSVMSIYKLPLVE